MEAKTALRGSVLRAISHRAQNTGVITAQRVTNFLTNIAALSIFVDMDGIGRILPDVHQLAVTYRLTSYDATYLELALRKNLPLASLDEDLRKACLKAGGSLLTI